MKAMKAEVKFFGRKKQGDREYVSIAIFGDVDVREEENITFLGEQVVTRFGAARATVWVEPPHGGGSIKKMVIDEVRRVAGLIRRLDKGFKPLDITIEV